MIDKNKVASFLAHGVGEAEIASSVGCDVSYISQLKSDPEIVAIIKDLRSQMTAEDVRFDETVETTETLALELIKQKLPFANLGQALGVFKTLNSARKRRDGPADNAANVTQVVLVLPQAHLPKYVTNQDNEIIEVEGRTMLTATPKSLERILEEKQGTPALEKANAATMEKAARLIGSLTNIQRKPTRRVPTVISPDVL